MSKEYTASVKLRLATSKSDDDEYIVNIDMEHKRQVQQVLTFTVTGRQLLEMFLELGQVVKDGKNTKFLSILRRLLYMSTIANQLFTLFKTYKHHRDDGVLTKLDFVKDICNTRCIDKHNGKYTGFENGSYVDRSWTEYTFADFSRMLVSNVFDDSTGYSEYWRVLE